MSDYPDIEREVPAWERMKPIFALPGSRFSPEWLTGLAQFVRAVQKPLEERIAALEEETAWIKRHMPAREVERIAATIPTEEKPQYPSCLGCIHYSKSPAEDPCSRCYGRSFYTAKSPTPPDLAERLAREAADVTARKVGEHSQYLVDYITEILLPLFRRAVEGSKGGEE